MYLNRIYIQRNKYINVSPYIYIYIYIYIKFGWPKSSFKFFILQKNPNELFGRPQLIFIIYIILYYIILYYIILYYIILYFIDPHL